MVRALLTVALALSLLGCERRSAPPLPIEASAAVRPKVTVLNADILVIEGKHYRLANAFAPEPVPDARCWAEALAAKQATRVVAGLVDQAASVQASPTGGVDDYNRTLATIHVDGADLGDVLFKQGLAARPGKGRFEWCNPISRNDPGAPEVFSMMELSPGRAPGQ
jgi:endonuclease YncB( thermonuclease family)